jgi:predicted small lipoprotein YifL
LGGAGFVFAGCGKKGDPFPPPSKVSAPIQNLQARQVGNELQLRMSYPTTTLSGLPLEGIESLEVWSTFIPVVLRTDVALDESGDEVEAVDEETAPVEIPDEEVVSDDQDEDEDTADEREADDRYTRFRFDRRATARGRGRAARGSRAGHRDRAAHCIARAAPDRRAGSGHGG